jgi:hypothetical protein
MSEIRSRRIAYFALKIHDFKAVPLVGRTAFAGSSVSRWEVQLRAMVLDRITRNPAVMGGKLCVRGMRVTVGIRYAVCVNSVRIGDAQARTSAQRPSERLQSRARAH